MIYKLFFIFGLSIAVIFGIAAYDDNNREWKKYQTEFLKMELQRASTPEEKASITLANEIKQIEVIELKKADRCTTCHMGVDNPKFADANKIYKTHLNFEQHPFERFGCTICHRGQGRATTVKAAHGDVMSWEETMLRKEYIQVSCGKCHSEQEIKGAPLLSLGRKLFAEKGCAGCHKIEGVSNGSIGPELSTVGSKYKHEFDYTRVKGEHTVANWIYEHFKNPQAVTPGTIMPNFNFTDEEAKSLTIYMLSLTKGKIPYEYRAGKKG